MKCLDFVLIITLSLGLISCNKCDPETQVFGDLTFNEETKGLMVALELDSLKFVDNFGAELILVKSQDVSRIRRVELNDFPCGDGNFTRGFFFAEERVCIYEGDDVQLIHSFQVNTNRLVRVESEIDLGKTKGQDFMSVMLISGSCDTISVTRAVQDLDGSSTILTSLIPFNKFGQRHETPYVLRFSSYPAGIVLTEEQGVVSFDYCGINVVQLEE